MTVLYKHGIQKSLKKINDIRRSQTHNLLLIKPSYIIYFLNSMFIQDSHLSKVTLFVTLSLKESCRKKLQKSVRGTAIIFSTSLFICPLSKDHINFS